MNRLGHLLFRPGTDQNARALVLVRVPAGLVFVVSGALKFLYANQGPGRFAHIGFPFPAFLSSFVGTVEIVAGALIIVGLMTRLAAIPLIVDMLTAIVTTKLSLLVGRGAEIPPGPPRAGFWAFAYQARLDVTMLMACAYLVVVGAGLWSPDAWISRKKLGRGRTESLHDRIGASALPDV